MFLHLHNTIHHIAVTVTSTPAVTVTPTVTPSSASPVTLVSTLLNPNAYGTVVSDLFGYNVSISGTRAIAGAPGESDAGGGFSGKAYIYDATNGSLLHTLDNPTPQAGANFGKSVAIDGNNAIVGAWQEDSVGETNSGAAYIFDVTAGGLLHTLLNPNAYGTGAYDNFSDEYDGVAISGNYAIVGAPEEDDAGETGSGKAYIFDVTTGNLLHTLDNPNIDGPASNDGFGYSVSIDGNYAIVGANNEEYAHIYDVVTGMLLYSIPNENAFGTAGGDQFGFSASISGNSVIIGAFSEDAAGGNSSGAAYIYNFTV